MFSITERLLLSATHFINHNGDILVIFHLIIFFYFTAPPPPPQAPQYVNPCVPSPCGPYSQCRDIGGSPSCSCLATYIGTPPQCRPECSINAECPGHLACISAKCRDPCPGSCGVGARCQVLNHTPICTCPEDYTGDPFSGCYPKPAGKFSLIF